MVMDSGVFSRDMSFNISVKYHMGCLEYIDKFVYNVILIKNGDLISTCHRSNNIGISIFTYECVYSMSMYLYFSY
jgi:hypothetical protein